MAKNTILKNDLLFHSVHGLCRVENVTRENSEMNYSLLPVTKSMAKVRFVVPSSSMETSGFDKLITEKQANEIMNYLKTGSEKKPQNGHAWELAKLIASESSSKDQTKDNRKRQKLEQSVRGLAGELAYVLKMDLRKTAESMQKNLAEVSKIHPLVLAALSSVEND